MNVMPLELVHESEIPTTPRHIHAEKSDRITGWRLLAIWTAGIVIPWSIVIGLGYGLAHIVRLLAGL